ncbi:MAG: hypothetical protein ACLQU1_12150 [Bryobacteraceae bacterium]
MNKKTLAAFLVLAPSALFGADSQWALEQSTLTYTMCLTRCIRSMV